MTTCGVEFADTDGLQVLRIVVDVVTQCNLRCLYCHPGGVWQERSLDIAKIRDVFEAVEVYGLLELVVSGGEFTMHPQLSDILQATHVLKRPTVTVITNGTRINDEIVEQIAASNVTRIAVSIDGVDNETHGSARGKNLKDVMRGLRALQGLGREITVISVAHQHNYHGLPQLTRALAAEGLASQHHYCAPSYSGNARQHYEQLRLDPDDFDRIQGEVEKLDAELGPMGFQVAFNSYWPATGRRGAVTGSRRTMTLQHISEQVKDSLMHVRPDGSVRVTSASWGRETVGNASVGNLDDSSAQALLLKCDLIYRSGEGGQLPREVEAQHKFQVGSGTGPLHERVTAALIDSEARPATLVDFVPVRRLDEHDVARVPFAVAERRSILLGVGTDPGAHRVVRHASGLVLVYNRKRALVTVLHQAEWDDLAADLATGS